MAKKASEIKPASFRGLYFEEAPLYSTVNRVAPNRSFFYRRTAPQNAGGEPEENLSRFERMLHSFLHSKENRGKHVSGNL